MSLSRDAAPGAIPRFFIRRVFRIYPLAMCVVIAAFLFRIPTKAWGTVLWVPIGTKQLLSNLLLIQNFTHVPSVLSQLWSLPLEVDMYVVLPVIFLAVNRNTRGFVVAFLLWVGACSTIILFYRATGHLRIEFVPCFLAGALAFRLRETTRIFSPWLCRFAYQRD